MTAGVLSSPLAMNILAQGDVSSNLKLDSVATTSTPDAPCRHTVLGSLTGRAEVLIFKVETDLSFCILLPISLAFTIHVATGFWKTDLRHKGGTTAQIGRGILLDGRCVTGNTGTNGITVETAVKTTSNPAEE